MARIPDDPTKAQVWVTKGLDELDFEFYFPQGPKGDPGGFTAATSLSTTNLNDIVVPGLYRQSLSTNATTLLNYPSASSGLLEVFEGQNSTDLLQRWTPWGGTPAVGRIMYVRRRDAAGAWSTWVNYASSRVDQTAGRAIYQWDSLNNRDQLIYGDTGWRTLSATDLPNMNAGSAYIRRIGSVVYLIMNGVAFSVVADTPGIPGFRSPISLYSPPVDVAALSGSPRRTLILAAGGIRIFDTAAMNFSMSYPTNDAWPTSLPGTANGSVPSI